MKSKRPASSSPRSTGRRRRCRFPPISPARRRRNSPKSTRRRKSAFPASPRAACRCCCRSTSTRSARTSWPGSADVTTSDKYFGPFQPSKFFLPGPAGYMATFWLQDGDGGIHFRYRKPIEISITGAGFTYDLDGPDHQEVFPVKDKESGGAVSRHQANPARGACALRVRALRRAIRGRRSNATTSRSPRAICLARRPIRSRRNS